MPKIESFEKYSEAYDQWFEKNADAYQAELELIRGLLPEKPGVEGLEVGVGSGKFAAPLGIRVGVEPSVQMAARAEKLGIRVVLGVAEDLPFPDASFDYLLLVTTICFVDDIVQAFAQAYRVLKPGGCIIVGFVDRESELGQHYAANRDKSKFYKEATFYSTPEVITYLQEAGFAVHSKRQTLIPGAEKGSIRDGYGEGAFVGIKAVKTSVEENSSG
ncbi:MAG: class I SAM-dependent methyltransferase [Desulfovermiculus sp.]|nr:class I SAM-dependent methyltransferase [Desulfovermiculus sp.]